MPKAVPLHATLSGTVRLSVQAKAAGKTPAKKQKLTMVINGGNAMSVPTFAHPVVIDMMGAQFAKNKTPIILDHDTRQRVGYTTANHVVQAGQVIKVNQDVINGPAIAASGVLSSTTDVAKSVHKDLQNGFPFEMSVGGMVTASKFYDEGETVQVNGQEFKGPIYVATSFQLKEASIVVLGADSDTSVSLAASGELNMEFKKWLKSQGLDYDKLDDNQRKALKATFDRLQAASPPAVPPADPPADPPATPPSTPSFRGQAADELATINAIRSLGETYSGVQVTVGEGDSARTLSARDYVVEALRDEHATPQSVELVLLRAARQGEASNDGASHYPAIHSVNRNMEASSISAAICRHLQMPLNATNRNGERRGLESHFTPEQLEASHAPQYRDISLHMLMDMNIAAAGRSFHGSRRSRTYVREFLHANNILLQGTGFSTLAVSNILEDVANKMLLDAWRAQDVAWPMITASVSVSDFKTYNMYRLTIKGGYEEVGAQGELKHGEFTDSKQTISAETYGMMLTLSRKDMINDDLNAFSAIPSNLGRLAAIALESAVMALILDNVATFFTSGRGNLLSGSNLDVDIAGYTAMLELFDKQVIDDKPILLTPDRVLVGTQDRIPAAQLNQETKVDVTTTANKPQFAANPHVGALTPIVSPYLNNTLIKKMDGSAFGTQNANQWFALVNPALLAAWRVAFLNGNRTPVIESAEADFNTLGMNWRSYHDWGVAEGDYQAAARSPGA